MQESETRNREKIYQTTLLLVWQRQWLPVVGGALEGRDAAAKRWRDSARLFNDPWEWEAIKSDRDGREEKEQGGGGEEPLPTDKKRSTLGGGSKRARGKPTASPLASSTPELPPESPQDDEQSSMFSRRIR